MFPGTCGVSNEVVKPAGATDAVEDAAWLAILFQAATLGLTLLLGAVRPVDVARSALASSDTSCHWQAAAGSLRPVCAILSEDELGGGELGPQARAIKERNQLTVAQPDGGRRDLVARPQGSAGSNHAPGIELTSSKASCIAFYDRETQRFTEWVTQDLSEHFVQNMSFRPGGLADEAFNTTTTTTTTVWHLHPQQRPAGDQHQSSAKLARDRRHQVLHLSAVGEPRQPPGRDLLLSLRPRYLRSRTRSSCSRPARTWRRRRSKTRACTARRKNRRGRTRSPDCTTGASSRRAWPRSTPAPSATASPMPS